MMQEQKKWGKKHYVPTDEINGFKVRPGEYLRNGANIVDGGISFTIHSNGATACNLCLFKRNEKCFIRNVVSHRFWKCNAQKYPNNAFSYVSELHFAKPGYDMVFQQVTVSLVG